MFAENTHDVEQDGGDRENYVNRRRFVFEKVVDQGGKIVLDNFKPLFRRYR